jgi:hypothetical protein
MLPSDELLARSITLAEPDRSPWPGTHAPFLFFIISSRQAGETGEVGSFMNRVEKRSYVRKLAVIAESLSRPEALKDYGA